MPYMIKFSENHLFSYYAGKELELYRIRRASDPPWVRDEENGTHWGYDHPKGGASSLAFAAGTEDVPELGAVSEYFEIYEVNKEYENLEELLYDIEGDVEFFPGLTVDNSEEVPDDEG